MAKTALVTGASSGIGKEVAKNLYKRGFKVILCARRRDRLEELAAELGENAEVLVADLSDKDECIRVYEDTKKDNVAVLVNAAGFGALGKFEEIPLERELAMIDTNVTAVHILTKLFVKDFKEKNRGYILNVASSAGLMYGGPLMATYYATKAYVVSLTSAISEELRGSGSRVSVSALCPGPVDTEFNEVADCKFGVKAITAEQCAADGIKGMFAKKLIIVPGGTMKAASAVVRIAPRRIALDIAGKIQEKKK